MSLGRASGRGLSGRCALLGVLVLGLLGVGVASAAAPAWRVVVLHPERGSTLNGVSCVSTLKCMAVGNVRNSWFVEQEVAGRWRRNSRLPVGAISCRGASCMALGNSSALPEAERWHGHRWMRQAIPVPPLMQSADLQGVSCGSSRACVAVGSSSFSSTVGCASFVFSPCTDSDALVERWDGHSWQIQNVPQPTGVLPSVPGARTGPHAELQSVSCSAANACMAVGTWSLGSPLNPQPSYLFAERWDGNTWTLSAPPTPTNNNNGSNPASVSCSGANACTMIGNTYHVNYSTGFSTPRLFAERWNGQQWTIEHVATPPGPLSSSNPYLVGISCPGARSCIAVGWMTRRRRARPLAEGWNGARWAIQPIPALALSSKQSTAMLFGVSCATPTACVAVGNYRATRGWLIERYSTP